MLPRVPVMCLAGLSGHGDMKASVLQPSSNEVAITKTQCCHIVRCVGGGDSLLIKSTQAFELAILFPSL